MINQLTIRKAGTADVPAIKSITDAAYSKWIPVIGRPPAPMLSNHAANVLDHAIYVAEVSNMPVAVLELIEEEDCLFIENLAVHPDWQGRGIANDLLDFSQNQCRTAGFVMLRLLTNQKFETNIAFYKKRGFVREYESEFMGGVTVHMVKHLV